MDTPLQTPQNQTDFKFQNMTRDELKRIQKSMKKPEFMGLLNQYMVEISDPKNRQEYDEYLRQMQRQGELPKHLKLVQLTPQFCIRTTIVSEKNKKHNMKFFINYCSTQFLDQPNGQPAMNQQGKSVFGWKIPNSMGKIRYDQDKNGNPCQVADVGFNPKCFQIIDAQNNLPFRKTQFKSMIISIGLECAQKQLGQRKQTLSKDFDILKNLKCKGGKPALLPVRYIQGKAYSKGQGPSQNVIERDSEGKQTKLQKQINQAKQLADKQKHKNEAKQNDQQMDEQLEEKKVLVQDLQQGIQQPKYSSIYTYPIDYSEFLQDQSYSKTVKTPSHFTVQFKLPRVEGMEQIGGDSLTVNQLRIILKIGDKYFIDLPFENFKLKYKLLAQKIKAKFDKKKKVLRIVLEVDQTVKYEQTKPIFKSEKLQEIEDSQIKQEQNTEIVQNQVWKNKVLQICQPAVDLKVIENNKQQTQIIQQPKNKLIQQIDEDDYPEAENSNNLSQDNREQPKSYDQALEQQKNHAFSLRKYYNKVENKNSLVKSNAIEENKIQASPSPLTYVFQETNDKIVLVIKLQNYKRQQVKALFDESQNNNFFIEWNQNTTNQSQLTKIHILNFEIADNFSKDIKKVEIVFRVNFLAVFIHKQTPNKFWQKQSIKTVIFNPSQQTNEYDQFKQQMNEVQTKNQQRSLQLKAIKQEQIKQVERNNASINQLNKQSIKATVSSQIKQRQSLTEDSGINNNIQELEKPQSQTIDEGKKQKLQQQYFNFNSLPPQFIVFDCKFIEVLD